MELRREKGKVTPRGGGREKKREERKVWVCSQEGELPDVLNFRL